MASQMPQMIKKKLPIHSHTTRFSRRRSRLYNSGTTGGEDADDPVIMVATVYGHQSIVVVVSTHARRIGTVTGTQRKDSFPLIREGIYREIGLEFMWIGVTNVANRLIFLSIFNTFAVVHAMRHSTDI
jgi:hypothetical protein